VYCEHVFTTFSFIITNFINSFYKKRKKVYDKYVDDVNSITGFQN